MKTLKDITHVYFLGIGGIGMSGLAQYFATNGKKVAGYDKTPGRMTAKLQADGIEILFADAIEKLPDAFKNKKHTLVVYTPAIPRDLRILKYFRERRLNLKKRSQVVADVAREMPTLAIAGTHGKTTTSCILAHLLKQSGYAITAFLGGVAQNYHTNFIGDGKEACVIEADEYDRSFLRLSPQYAGITSMDADHLDIYQEVDELRLAFHEFAGKVKSPDKLFYKKGLSLKGCSIGLEETADYSLENIRVDDGTYHFDLKTPQGLLKDLRLTLPGQHNLFNAGMALAMALKFGADAEKLSRALEGFRGVERRFTYHLKTDKHILIEDYAHHPAELKAACQAVREMHPERKVLAVFQPHLYSRTRDFAQGFAESLSRFDQVVLLPVYPAREAAIPGIDAAYLLRLMSLSEKKLVTRDKLVEAVKNSDASVVMMLGAGDIGNEVERVKKAWV